MPNYGSRKHSKCIFDLDRCFEIRRISRIRDIRVRDIESRRYVRCYQLCADWTSQIEEMVTDLFQQPRARVLCNDGLCDVLADVLELHQLLLPHLQQTVAILVHFYPTHAFLME